MTFGFALKKLVSLFLTPLAVGIEAILVGWLLLVFWNGRFRFCRGRPATAASRRRARLAGSVAILGGVFILYAASIEPVARRLAAGLERHYAPFPVEAGEDGDLSEPAFVPEFIVVLGGGQLWGEGKPALSTLSHSALARVVGAVELAGHFPEATFVVTGTPAETRAMRAAAAALGVPEKTIVRETLSRDTADHPRYVGEIVGERPFLLVTSATHQPRSMALFRSAGLDPVAAPTDFRAWDPGLGARASSRSGPLGLPFPSPRHLDLTHIACHEWLGLAWARVRGQTR